MRAIIFCILCAGITALPVHDTAGVKSTDVTPVSVLLQETVDVGCSPPHNFWTACSAFIANAADRVFAECTNACYNSMKTFVTNCGHLGYMKQFTYFYEQCKSSLPTPAPTDTPTESPTTRLPSPSPSRTPTENPTSDPTHTPTRSPTDSPTAVPSNEPSYNPTENPTFVPTHVPTNVPTEVPTTDPTAAPTEGPTQEPTSIPTVDPTAIPTETPTSSPTTLPPTTDEPSFAPTMIPTSEPSAKPTADPTMHPTEQPTVSPTENPTPEPSLSPTDVPTHSPSHAPTAKPSPAPTMAPTPACQDRLLSDLAVVMDSSNSIFASDWDKLAGFAQKLVKDFPISDEGMNVAGVQFASKVGTLFPLTGSKATAMSSLKKVQRETFGSETRTDLAIEMALQVLKQGRAGARDIMLVITDGVPTGGSNPGSPADKAFIKAKAAGVKVVFVLVGWLFKWLPTPSHWSDTKPIIIDSYAGLESVRSEVIATVCKHTYIHQSVKKKMASNTQPLKLVIPRSLPPTADPTAAPLRKYLRRETASPTAAPTQRCCRTAASCSARGDPHYTSFDGKRFNFFGAGEYFLIKNPQVHVKTTTGSWGKESTWSKRPTFNIKLEIQPAGSKDQLTVTTAPGHYGYNRINITRSFPGAAIKMGTNAWSRKRCTSACYLDYCNKWSDLKKAFCGKHCHTGSQASKCQEHWRNHGLKEGRRSKFDPDRCALRPNLDVTTITFASLGLKIVANAWPTGRGLDVWVETFSGFACGEVTGLCGNFDCNNKNDLPGWTLRQWPAMETRNHPPATQPMPSFKNYCDSDSKLKGEATALCKVFTPETRKDCMEDICFTGETSGMNTEFHDMDVTDKVVKADIRKLSAPAHPSTPLQLVLPRSLPPTAVPTKTPTEVPSTLVPTTDEPSFAPSHTPTEHPTLSPTKSPTLSPTALPTSAPLEKYMRRKTLSPTSAPTQQCCRTAASCSAVGDPHYTSFDGKRFDFFGAGDYFLIKNPQVHVKTTTGSWGKESTWSKRPTFNIKLEIQPAGSKDQLTVTTAPGHYGYNRINITRSFPGAAIKMGTNAWSRKRCYLDYCNKWSDLKKAFCGKHCHTGSQASKCQEHWRNHGLKEGRRSKFDPDRCASNLDVTTITFASLGLKIVANAWPTGRGLDVWVETFSGFACGEVTGLCGNFDCNNKNDLPGWTLRQWPAMETRNHPPATQPMPSFKNYCDSDSKLKGEATALCKVFTPETRKDCMEDICFSGETSGMNTEFHDMDVTDKVVKADIRKLSAPAHPSTPLQFVLPRSLPPTAAPTKTPTEVPSTLVPTTDEPSFAPSHTPTEHPTLSPTKSPTLSPTALPTSAPLEKYVRRKTLSPTSAPTQQCCRTAASCSAVGDPHYRTFDGKKFNFFGLGEHYLMKNSKLTIKSTTGGCKCNGGCQRWCRNQPSFNTKIEIQVLGSNESLTIENAPGLNGYNKLKMPAKFPGASIKTYRSSGQPNLDRTLVTFDSLGVKVRVNAWQYHKTHGGFYATDGGIDKGMDVWVQTTPRFACGKVTGLCGNFDCNGNNDLPGWHLRRWPAMQPRNEPPSPPSPPITNYCDTNSNLKTKATEFCSKFTVDTRHDCMEDICLTGQIITGMEQELQGIDETNRLVKADIMAAATGSLHATQLFQRSSSLAGDWTPVGNNQLITSQ